MARPDEPLNHENLSLIVALYQSIVTENPKAWVIGKVKAPKVRSLFRSAQASKRPGRGRMTRDICGYRVTIMCEMLEANVARTETTIRMSAPGWSVNLRGHEFTGRAGESGYAVQRVGEMFSVRLHFTTATAQGLDKFKHQMTLITMFSDITPLAPQGYSGAAW